MYHFFSEPETTTTEVLEDCCTEIELTSQAGAQEHYHEALGLYQLESLDTNGKPIYRHKTNLITTYLHHTTDLDHNWSGWQFTRDISDVFGFVANANTDQCPSGPKNQAWQYHLNGQWFDDETIQVTCTNEQTTTTIHPTTIGPMTSTTTIHPTTPGPSPSTTTKPQPGQMERTVIFVYKQTFPGSDVFIIGGQPDKTPIDIKVNHEFSV